jgi:hypothetical protein
LAGIPDSEREERAVSEEQRESKPGELLRSEPDRDDEEGEPKRQGPQGERDDDPDHGYGQLAP